MRTDPLESGFSTPPAGAFFTLPPRGVLLFALALTVALAIAVVAPAVHVAGALVGSALVLGIGLRDQRIVLAALILAIPTSRWTRLEAGQIAVTAADVILAILMAFWLIRGLTERRLRLYAAPTILGAALLFSSALLSSLMAEDFPTALEELVKLAELIAIALYAAAVMRIPSNAVFAAQVLVLAAAAESIEALVQSVVVGGPTSFALGELIRAYGDFDQPNALGGYLAMILPFGVVLSFQRWPTRPFLVVGTLLIAVTLAATLSRGAWLGVGLGLLLIGWLWSTRARKVLAMAILTGSAAAAFAGLGLAPQVIGERLGPLTEYFVVFDARTVQVTSTNWSLVERMAHWQAGWAMGLDHPLVGVGPGNYETAYYRYHLPDWPFALGHAHNVYINTFAEMGLVGLIILVGFLATLFVRIGQGIRAFPEGTFGRAMLLACLGSATAFATHNMFDNMFVHGIGIQFGLILGMVEAIVTSREETSAYRH